MARLFSLATALALLVSCSPGASEPGATRGAPSFDLRISGAEDRSLSGRGFAAPTKERGFIEFDPVTNAEVTRPRTQVLFYPADLSDRSMLTIDLIGILKPTSFLAYADNDYAQRTQFLSTYFVVKPNGFAREFRLSRGTVVVTSVDASHLSGTVTLEFAGYVDPMPGSGPPPMVLAPLSITGTFNAAWMRGP